MPASVATPVARQNRSKLAPTSCQAPSTIAAGSMAADVVNFFMALLSFVDSAPRAYRLKAGNACSPFSTSIGTSPHLAREEFDRQHACNKGGTPEPIRSARRARRLHIQLIPNWGLTSQIETTTGSNVVRLAWLDHRSCEFCSTCSSYVSFSATLYFLSPRR